MLQIHSGNLYKALRDFHTLTGIRIVILDKAMKQLISYPSDRIPFCDLISRDTELVKKCIECDAHNCQVCAQTKSVLHYRCHMGLMEAITPIYDNQGLLGYAMFGQVLMRENYKETRSSLKKLLSEEQLPGITKAIDSIPIKSSAELNASVTILQALVAYFLSNQWITPERSEFIRHMDNFIEDNLSKNITVEDICEEFHIRRTRLYSLATEYLGCSIAKYIRQQRIFYACKMLRETDLSVTSIAYAVGFSDYGHFSQIFQQVQGLSATAYRRNMRHGSAKDKSAD